jgi:hypothetical protein
VIGNYVSANSGGILLTDENGPTDGDLIASNRVVPSPLTAQGRGHQIIRNRVMPF